MVYYNEIPEINKRMVAGYYLFLCLIGFAILLGPTGSGIPITLVGTSDRDKHEALLSRLDWGLTDPSACDGAAPCHGNRYGNWSLTGHRWAAWYNASSDHIVLGQIEMGFNVFNATTGTNLFNDSHCVTCHTTGWDNSTGTPTYDYLGVNCFACHDVNADEWVDYSGDTCGAVCHTGDLFGDHPQQYPVWNRSRHANSMTDLRTSTHASSRCMHCQATEAFIHQQNPGELATTSPNVDQVNWNPYLNDIYNYTSISCPACHAVHSNWTEAGTPAYIRAVNASELCGLCHSQYDVWIGGPHNLAGVECIDCHGYDITTGPSPTAFLNHTFAVKPDLACGQAEECHDGEQEEWALGQLEMIEEAFTALVTEITAEATDFGATVLAYNATADADHALANTAYAAVENAEDVVDDYAGDGSSGFHYPHTTFEELNAAYASLLDAKADFYEALGAATVTVTVTETVTVTTTVTVVGGDTLLLVGGSVGGIVVGLVLGVLVGRRR